MKKGRILGKFDSETFDDFDEWLVICQSFPYKPLSLNVSPLKPTINLSKFFLVKFCVIHIQYTHMHMHTHTYTLGM